MPREDIQIDLSPTAGKTFGILSPSMMEAFEPYADFVNALHAEGRITDEELDALHLQLDARLDGMTEEMERRLNKVH
ncbi:hypothetical protein [Nitrospira japonica]|uniref:hypothetical protein n=1 Tax=Nitrospira japonica TaxID=1325564 RepID=UPI0012DCAC76|nr:hypothetical protein [Nitrospira japonica]